MIDDEHTMMTRRVRYHMARAEDALDIAVLAITRVREIETLDPLTRAEVKADIDVMRTKLSALSETLDGE